MRLQSRRMETVKQWFRDYNSDERAEQAQKTFQLIAVGVIVVLVLLVLARLG